MVDGVSGKQDVRAQTWEQDAEDVIHSVAHWMLVESVAANHSWTTLNVTSGLVNLGMEMVRAVAAYRGIHAGHVVATGADLLDAMKDVAHGTNAPADKMPMWQPAPPPAHDARQPEGQHMHDDGHVADPAVHTGEPPAAA